MRHPTIDGCSDTGRAISRRRGRVLTPANRRRKARARRAAQYASIGRSVLAGSADGLVIPCLDAGIPATIVRDSSTVMALREMLDAGLITQETSGEHSYRIINDAMIGVLGPALRKHEDDYGDVVHLFRHESGEWECEVFDRCMDEIIMVDPIIAVLNKAGGEAALRHAAECADFRLRSEELPALYSDLHRWLGWLIQNHDGLGGARVCWDRYLDELRTPPDEGGGETLEDLEIQHEKERLARAYPYLLHPCEEPPMTAEQVRDKVAPHDAKLADLLYALGTNLKRPDGVGGDCPLSLIAPSIGSRVAHGIERLDELIRAGYYDGMEEYAFRFCADSIPHLRTKLVAADAWAAPIQSLCMWSYQNNPTSA